MLHLKITTGSDVPIFRQIIAQIRSAIATGKLSVGDPLPSVRGLASELVVNHNTVAKAYAQLTRDGVIESHQGRGYFVAKRREIYTKAERTRRVVSLIRPLVSEAILLGFSQTEVTNLIQKEFGQIAESDNRVEIDKQKTGTENA